jgi:hypothetical protein
VASQKFARYTYDPNISEKLPLAPTFPAIWLPGIRGGGKTTTKETFEEYYYEKNYLIMSLWATPDHENAYWCIPDLYKVFSWRRVPGKQEEKLRHYLKLRFLAGAKWIDSATLEKREGGDVIVFRSLDGSNVLMIVLTMRGYRADLVLNDKKIWWFVVKHETQPDKEVVKVVYDANPFRPDSYRVRRIGYPVLIIKPNSTIFEPKPGYDPLCVCGIPLKVHGDPAVPCQAPDPLIKHVSDDESLQKIIELAITEKRVIVFNRGFYFDHRYAYLKLADMLFELPYLVVQDKIPNVPIVLGFSELSNLVPQGMMPDEGKWQTATKRAILRLIKDARHYSMVMIGDFQRNQDIQKPVAAQRDIIVFKRTTPDLMPEDYVQLFFEIEQKRRNAYYSIDQQTLKSTPSMSHLKDWQAYMLLPNNHYKLISTFLPGFHHKQTGEKWGPMAGIKIKYLPMETSKTKAKAKKLMDKAVADEKFLEHMREITVARSQGIPWAKIPYKKYGFKTDNACRVAYYRAIQDGLVASGNDKDVDQAQE